MKKNQKQLKRLTKQLIKLDPVSVFLYGSRARGDFLESSDWEIGIVFSKDSYLHRDEMIEKIDCPHHIKVYPFREKNLREGRIDTPFQTNIHLLELKQYAKTIAGQDHNQILPPVKISLLSILQEIRFELGYALAALIANQANSSVTTRRLFFKSCIFGTRAYLLYKTGQLFGSYEDIFFQSRQHGLTMESDVVKHAYDVRHGASLDIDYLFKNISYLNQFVEVSLTSSHRKKGNVTVIST